MTLKNDMVHGVQDNDTNFTCQLLRLFQKADPGNLALLAMGFPNASDVFNAWQSNQPIPDLPYDEYEEDPS